MSDWEETTLGEACAIEIGGTPSRSEESYWWKSAKDGQALPWVSISDMKKRVVSETKESITEIGARNSNCKHIAKGTLLMSFKLTIGRMAFAGKDLYTNEAIAAIRPREGINPEFLYYGLQYWNLTHGTDQAVKGVTLNKQKLQEIRCSIPPFPEQKKIASVLSHLDGAIETTQKQINKLYCLKKATTNELLTKGIDHKEFKKSELGRIPNDWESVALGEFCREIVVGHVGSTSENYTEKDGVRFIRTGDLKDGKIRLTETKQITREFHHKLKKSSLKRDDVLVSRVGDTGQAALVPEDLGEANCANIIIIRCGDKLLPQFLRIFINSEFFFDQVARVSIGSAQAVLNITIIKQLLLSLPSVEEQRRICSMVNESENLIGNLKWKLTQTKILKKSLMQDLLSGSKRVNI